VFYAFVFSVHSCIFFSYVCCFVSFYCCRHGEINFSLYIYLNQTAVRAILITWSEYIYLHDYYYYLPLDVKKPGLKITFKNKYKLFKTTNMTIIQSRR